MSNNNNNLDNIVLRIVRNKEINYTNKYIQLINLAFDNYKYINVSSGNYLITIKNSEIPHVYNIINNNKVVEIKYL